MKKYLFLSPLAALFAVSCTDNEFLGTEEAQHTVNGEVAINFESGAAALTRADKIGSEAAELLNNNFVVEGIKNNGSYTIASGAQLVFDHYNVNYFPGTANSTETNVANWEYVGQKAHSNSSITTPYQVIKYWDYSYSQYDFVAFSYGKSGKKSDGVTPLLTLSDIDFEQIGNKPGQTPAQTPVYTVTGKPSELAKSYVANLETVYKDQDKYSNAGKEYTNRVTPHFRQMGTRVRIAIYETVPGYSVKDVKFYTDKTRNNPATAPVLYSDEAVLPTDGVGTSADVEGKMKVYFPTVGSAYRPGETTADLDYNKAHVEFEGSGAILSKTMSFGALKYTTRESGETNTGNAYLGRTSALPTYATGDTSLPDEYILVLPYGAGTDLHLHVDYTLESIDGSKELIHVKSATALVPAVYTNWQPNFAYTYLFKISKNTNGTTGDPGDPDNPGNPGSDPTDPSNPTPDPSGLYPITFDAVVMDFGDGIQETITTVSNPSITTYAKDANDGPTTQSEYNVLKNIYVSIDKANVTLTPGINANLYKAVVAAGAIQPLDEGSIANAIAKGQTYKPVTVAVGDNVSTYYTYSAGMYTACGAAETAAADVIYYEADTNSKTVVDAAGKPLTVTAITGTDGLTSVTAIPAEDATYGVALPGKFAVFIPTTDGTYVFEYIVGTGATAKKYYKIIIVH